MNMTVAERLVAFAQDYGAGGVPDDVAHEAKRLLLNQLKASVGATDHEAIRILHDWATATAGAGDLPALRDARRADRRQARPDDFHVPVPEL